MQNIDIMRLCLLLALQKKTTSRFLHVSVSNSDFNSGTLPRVQPNAEFKTEMAPMKPQTLIEDLLVCPFFGGVRGAPPDRRLVNVG